MSKYKNILDAWITIEQLSEGAIQKKDVAYGQLDARADDWEQFYLQYIQESKLKSNISDEKLKNTGLVMYLGIFDFEEVLEILREKYQLSKTEEDITTSEKFTLALYFDHELNFLSDKLFLTISGFIRNEKDFPKNLLEKENALKEALERKFQKGFHEAFDELYDEYEVTSNNFRYKFLRNINSDDTQLHSFFIEDLTKAKDLHNKNLERYLQGSNVNEKNLNSQRESEDFKREIFQEILQPKNYPLGRFPSNADFSLSFMQQVAVNLALDEANPVLSVNGPPGTGKTTLLKDIFADLIVQQAFEIASMDNQLIKPTLIYHGVGKIGILPSAIAEKNIVVASSNNGAVQNIVNELPKRTEISDEFIEAITAADYFTDISNGAVEENGKKTINPKVKTGKADNWGTFSLEGGNTANIKKLLSTIQSMKEVLEDKNYTSDSNIYNEFMEMYNHVKQKRKEMQTLSEKVYHLEKLNEQLITIEKNYQSELQEKQKALSEAIAQINSELQVLQSTVQAHNEKSTNIQQEIAQNDTHYTQTERDYEIILDKKPSFLWLQKIFFSAKVKAYFQERDDVNNALKRLKVEKNELENEQRKIAQSIVEKTKASQQLQSDIDYQQQLFDDWMTTQQREISNLKEQLNDLEQELASENVKSIEFSSSYEQLQKSNPWFDREFRVLQSTLFIYALKVRKQFLYENKRSLKGAYLTWKNLGSNISKENGVQLISEAWHWLNFAIPVISTTFASFGRMFKHVAEGTIGHLFIDEAGQALPQSSVGGFFRSKNILVVGDPSQIKPVLTLDSNVLNLIGRHHNVDERYVSADASTQTLTDAASQYGFRKTEDDWIGIPLWVHRRCNDPMFSISNKISYNGLMVQGKDKSAAKGKSEWIHVSGTANNKYVAEQGDKLKELISNQLKEHPELAKDIYVISPFKHVADQLTKKLEEINFPIREKNKLTNIGTVHTFQGKEAKIVYLVLGADQASKGAASWAVSDPNIMNVAATRAKEEFYIIGDKTLYNALGSQIVTDTICTIDEYNVHHEV